MRAHEEQKMYETMWDGEPAADFTVDDLRAALETKSYIFVGRSFDDLFMSIDGEPYSDTVYEVSKTSNAYTLNSTYVSADGGEREGDEEEYSTVEELYARILELDLEDMPSAKELLEEIVTDKTTETLTEARSVAEIEADIERLKRELAQAKEEEKRATAKASGVSEVWYWDMYKDPEDKGSWISIDSYIVFETEDEAIDAGWVLLNELDDQGDLDDDGEYTDPDDYTVEAHSVPVSRVPHQILNDSELGHLWDPTTAGELCIKCPSCHSYLLCGDSELNTGFRCPYCNRTIKRKSAGLKEAKGQGLANISDEEIIRAANVERGLGDIVSSPKTPREKEVNDNIISWWRDNAPQLDRGQMTPEMFNAGFRSIIGMRNGKYEPDSLFDRDWEYKQLSKRK